MLDRAVEPGLCGCGCGGQTTTARTTDRRKGTVKGRPHRYLRGHNGRKVRALTKAEISRRYRERHPDRRRFGDAAQYRRRRQDPAQRARDVQRSAEWKREHPDQAAAIHRRVMRRANAARRARKRGQFVEHVDPLEVLLRDEGVCGICNERVDPRNFHVDHIVPLSAGGLHGYANVQVAHPRCNMRKGGERNLVHSVDRGEGVWPG